MTINQIIKWRQKLLSGKGDKYYPKELLKNLLNWSFLNMSYPQNKKYLKLHPNKSSNKA